MTGHQAPEDHRDAGGDPAAVTGGKVELHPWCVRSGCHFNGMEHCAVHGCSMIHARDALRRINERCKRNCMTEHDHK
jgi:hypothetical protein